MQSFQHQRTLWNQREESEKPRFPSGHPVRWTDENGAAWFLSGHGLPDLQIPAEWSGAMDPSKWRERTPQTKIETVHGDEVRVHRGSLTWNDNLKQWLFLFTEIKEGDSPLGNIWLCVSDSPFGPFGKAIQVAEHVSYTFYNPMLHSEWMGEDSPTLLFEGTFTHTFSNNPSPVPRAEYNQVLYRIELDDEAFAAWR